MLYAQESELFSELNISLFIVNIWYKLKLTTLGNPQASLTIERIYQVLIYFTNLFNIQQN